MRALIAFYIYVEFWSLKNGFVFLFNWGLSFVCIRLPCQKKPSMYTTGWFVWKIDLLYLSLTIQNWYMKHQSPSYNDVENKKKVKFHSVIDNGKNIEICCIGITYKVYYITQN